jgi:hypothetical protein
MSKKHLTQIISVILSFLLMVCITVIMISSCLAITAIKTGFVTDLMDDSYYQSVMNSLTETLKQKLSPPSNIPEEVFDNLFTIYFVKEDLISNTNAVFAGIEDGYNKERVREHVIENFEIYASDNNLNLSLANLQTLADYCLEEYDRHINLVFLKSFAPIREMFEKMFTYILLGFSVILILLTLFLFGIHKYKHRALRFLSCSLFSSSLLIIPLPLFLLIQGSYRRLNIEPEHIKLLFIAAINKTMSALILSGLIIFAVGITLVLLTKKMREKAIKGQIRY